MGLLFVTGGMPKFLSGGADTTLTKWDFNKLGGRSGYVVMKNTGATDMLITFDEKDADDSKLWTLAAGATIEWPVHAAEVWVKTASGTSTWELLAFITRG